MAKPFPELRERLLRAGVAPRHVRRYLGELADHLADLRAEVLPGGPGGSLSEAAALERLGGPDALCRAMIERRQFQSLCARAPWAMFGIAPVLALAGAYLAACTILWSGWRIFLPQSGTPFVPIGGAAILYFGVGKLLYFSAPILVGLGAGTAAIRQRLPTSWCTIGMALVALAGGTAQVHAIPSARGGGGQVRMDFTLGHSGPDITFALVHALAIFSLALLPGLVWRFRQARGLPA